MKTPTFEHPYAIHDAGSLPGWLAGFTNVRELLGGRPEDWRVREVGDGNLNLVFLVDGPDDSVCVKQALPYVRAAGPSWPMSPQRIHFEQQYFAAVGPHVGGLIPKIHHYDAEHFCLIMECLTPHVILRRGLIAGERFDEAAPQVGEYAARACFFSTDFARPFEEKLRSVARFAGNSPLIRISVDLIFTDPYRAAERNRHTTPQLDGLVAELRADTDLKLAAAAFGYKFLNETQALIHGDLHSGSVMVTNSDTRVIDPEFACHGPIGFDLGAFLANLLLAWYAQPGHAEGRDDRDAYQRWILDQARRFWESFRRRFLALWDAQPRGDAYPTSMFPGTKDLAALRAAREAFVDGLFADMLGFAACKMIRRIVGFAHVADFERIADADRRAACEAGALRLARELLTRPHRFRTIDDLLGEVPSVRRRAAPSGARRRS